MLVNMPYIVYLSLSSYAWWWSMLYVVAMVSMGNIDLYGSMSIMGISLPMFEVYPWFSIVISLYHKSMSYQQPSIHRFMKMTGVSPYHQDSEPVTNVGMHISSATMIHQHTFEVATRRCAARHLSPQRPHHHSGQSEHIGDGDSGVRPCERRR